MSDHDIWVDRGFCDAVYVGDADDEHWCRMPMDHRDSETGEPDKHIAPWEYEFPRQETMVRWNDGPADVEWIRWVPDPTPTI